MIASDLNSFNTKLKSFLTNVELKHVTEHTQASGFFASIAKVIQKAEGDSVVPNDKAVQMMTEQYIKHYNESFTAVVDSITTFTDESNAQTTFLNKLIINVSSTIDSKGGVPAENIIVELINKNHHKFQFGVFEEGASLALNSVIKTATKQLQSLFAIKLAEISGRHLRSFLTNKLDQIFADVQNDCSRSASCRLELIVISCMLDELTLIVENEIDAIALTEKIEIIEYFINNFLETLGIDNDSTSVISIRAALHEIAHQIRRNVRSIVRNNYEIHLNKLHSKPRPTNKKDILIARILSNDLTLEHLDLSYDSYVHKDILEILQALIHNHIIQSINLTSSNLGDYGAELIAQVLKTNKSISDIRLGHSMLTLKGLDLILKSQRVNPKLQRLDISKNDLQSKCLGEDFANHLIINCFNIEDLDIGDLYFSEAGLAAFIYSIRSKTKLKHVNINRHGSIFEAELIHILNGGPTYTKEDIIGYATIATAIKQSRRNCKKLAEKYFLDLDVILNILIRESSTKYEWPHTAYFETKSQLNNLRNQLVPPFVQRNTIEPRNIKSLYALYRLYQEGFIDSNFYHVNYEHIFPVNLILDTHQVQHKLNDYLSRTSSNYEDNHNKKAKISFEVQQLIIVSKADYHNWLSSCETTGKQQTYVYNHSKLNKKSSKDDFNIISHEPKISVDNHRLRADSL